MSGIRFITYTLNGMRVVLDKSIFQMHKSKLLCMQTAEIVLWTRLESVIFFFGWTSFTNVFANQTTCQTNNTISQLCGNFPVFRWCGTHRPGRRRVVQRTWSFGSERAFGCSPPPIRCSHPDRGCMCVCVAWLRPVCSRCEALMSESGNGTATLQSPSIPHWAVSPLSRWCAAAGAPLPDNYQPSPQMETSVSPHRSRFLPLPPSTAPLYLGKALPTLTMCFVTAD